MQRLQVWLAGIFFVVVFRGGVPCVKCRIFIAACLTGQTGHPFRVVSVSVRLLGSKFIGFFLSSTELFSRVRKTYIRSSKSVDVMYVSYKSVDVVRVLYIYILYARALVVIYIGAWSTGSSRPCFTGEQAGAPTRACLPPQRRSA